MKLQMSLEIILSLTLAGLIAASSLFYAHSMIQNYGKSHSILENAICSAINYSVSAAASCKYCIYQLQERC